MRKKFNFIFVALFIVAALSGCQGEPSVVGQASKDRNVFTSHEQHFSLEYPSSWKVTNQEGIIISANDQNVEPWGGTHLNLQYHFESGDVTMGWKESKMSEEYLNPQGLRFTLFFYEPDEKFENGENVEVDRNDVHILINTDVIPGLKMFSYNKTVNPAGEQQLKDILKTVSKTAER